MSAGLAALLDDIAVLAKMAAASVDDVAAAASKASAKAAGVVVDDTAVTPRYVHGFTADREIPIIKKIAKGSLINKLVFILPAILVLSQWAPFLLPPLLMIGGCYLSFEGAEKIWEKLGGGHHAPDEAEATAAMRGPEHEETMTKGAIRTDFILSAEIMVISLNEVMSQDPPPGFWMRAIVLVVVAIAITILVYGVVGLIVKMDDFGLSLAERPSEGAQKAGLMLVKAMPKLLAALSTIGIVAMLWVGGHILLVQSALPFKEGGLGLGAVYETVHHWEEAVGGGILGWLLNTFVSAVVGLVVGAVIVAVMHVLPFGNKHGSDEAHGSGEAHGAPAAGGEGPRQTEAATVTATAAGDATAEPATVEPPEPVDTAAPEDAPVSPPEGIATAPDER